MAAGQTAPAPSGALVFYGATGDLAHKKIFPALYRMVKAGELTVPVVGVAFSGWNLDQLRERARDSIQTYGGGIDDRPAFDRLLKSLRYVDGDYNDRTTFERLKTELGESKRPAHYLAIPPSQFETVVGALGSVSLAGDARVIVEKPFGRDLASARELNQVLASVFPEASIFRIDHYLGKEETQNLMYFRFSNSFLEPIWNRNYVAHVHITMAEDFGVQGRGKFYDSVGALRDVVENHLLQVVGLLAMEPPVGRDFDAQREEKIKVLRAIRPLSQADLIRGQFDGYRDEDGVAPDSDVETFAAVRLHVDNWRWDGVPWFVRAGKMLARTVTEVLVEFKAPPAQVFEDSRPVEGRANYLRFRFAPTAAIALAVRVKLPGELWTGEQKEMYLCSDNPAEPTPYERLLGDAMAGDQTLFVREDGVEAAWRVVDHVLSHHHRAYPYKPGSWGPPEADQLVKSRGGWHEPGP